MAAKITNVYLLSESKTESTNSCEPRSGMRRQEHAICQLIATRSLGASSRTSASVAFDSEQVTLKTEPLGKLMLSIQGVPAVVLSAIGPWWIVPALDIASWQVPLMWDCAIAHVRTPIHIA